MIQDMAEVSYEISLVTSEDEELNLSDVLTSLGWEDNEEEIAQELTAEFHNDSFRGAHLSDFAKLNCKIKVRAHTGNASPIVFDGEIRKWNVRRNGAGEQTLSITALEKTYDLQKSQHSFYVEQGQDTKKIVENILDGSGVSMGIWDIEDIQHGKMIFNGTTIAEAITSVIQDNARKTRKRVYLRYDPEANALDFVAHGSNKIIWNFEAGRNALSTDDCLDTLDLITAVKIVGKSDNEGRDVIEGTVVGKVEYGSVNMVRNRDQNTSLERAIQDAEELIQERGNPRRSLTVEAPDVPTLRKGDKIHLTVSTMDDYCYVKSIRHDAGSKKMTMEVETKSMYYERPKINTVTKRYKISGFNPVPGDSNQALVWNALRARGYTAEAAAAVLGNMDRETGGTFDPGIIQGGGAGPGRGLCQWESSAMGGSGRWEKLITWCSSQGYDPLTIDGQVAFMDYEMTADQGINGLMMHYTKVSGEEFKQLTDVKQATDVFLRGFEIAAPSGYASNITRSYNSAMEYYEKWKDFDKVPKGGIGSGSYIWPIDKGGGTISSSFGNRSNPFNGTTEFHLGIDISAPGGTPVVATDGGTVEGGVQDWSYGNCVVIDHGNGLKSRYAHLSGFNCVVGQGVGQGNVIGFVGSTGASTGNHLHFEIIVNGSVVNPMLYVSK